MKDEIRRAFAVLEVDSSATATEIRAAYLDLVKVWHPDRYQNEPERLRKRAEEKLKEITVAYEQLRQIDHDGPLGDLTPMDFGNAWGYVDDTGRLIIHPEFAAATEFHEDLAAVMMVQKWGYIDRAGQFRVTPLYEECRRFSEGLAAVKWYGRWGFIDKTGAFVVQPRFQEVNDFNFGWARVRLGQRWGKVSRNGVAEFGAGQKIDFR